MKKRLIMLLTALLAAASISVPAMADEYGAIYDETGELWSQELEDTGINVMHYIAEAYGIDVRADILTQIGDASTVDEAAAYLYENYGYGEGEGKNGITLTVLLGYDGTSYYLNSNADWCVYVSGASSELTEDIADEIAGELLEKLNPEAFNGDLASDRIAIEEAADAFADEVEDMAKDGRFSETIYDPVAMQRLDRMAEPADGGAYTEPENGAQLNHITDMAGLLTDSERTYLENKAREVSKKHNCGIYIVTVEDYTALGYDDIYKAAYEIYHGNNLGMGTSRNGAVLLLSMAERDYATFFYGAAEGDGKAFNTYSEEELEKGFLEDFRENDWDGGFESFIDGCDECLTMAEKETPITEPETGIGVCAVIGIVAGAIVAIIVCLILKTGMKTVKKGTTANKYIAGGGLKLTGSRDLYTHTTETRRKIEKSGGRGGSGSVSRSGGGGSGRSGSGSVSRSGGGGSGRSGKF